MVHHNRPHFLVALLGILMVASPAGGEPFLRLIQPYQDSELPYLQESFVFGSVLPATSTLTINGIRAHPYKNGGFIQLIPFESGRFKIEAVASDGVGVSTVTRYVHIGEGPKDYPPTYGEIDPDAPNARVVLRPQDLLTVAFHGATKGKGSFRFKGRSTAYPMVEVEPGFYKGSYVIQTSDRFDKERFILYLKRKDGKKLSRRAPGSLTVQRRSTPRYIKLRDDSVLLTGPGPSYGYSLFFMKGTQLEVTGEYGGFLRVALDNVTQGWIKRSVAINLPSGTPPARSVAHNIRIDATEDSTLLELPLDHVHPYRVEQYVDPHRIELTLFGVVADTDRIRYKSPDSVIQELNWKQYTPGAYTLNIRTKQKYPWGYEVRYENGSLFLEIRHRPLWKPSRLGSLHGLKIAVDAGHTKSNYGTIGPWGNTEASVVLMTAKVVQRFLESRGAKVVMIQDGTKELSLTDRIDIAWRERADLFISIHADACGEGQNPFELEGHSTHYYHPQSRLLAEAIHKEYQQRSKFTDQGIWRSNLAVCRTTHMPSVLFEMGFLILPEYEEIMLTKDHHDLVAQSLAAAIVDFMKETR
jgi:N-acetylmuramoyl-L-alanine amidase